MEYYFFLDETGDHGLSFIDKNFPIFLLCGCLFEKTVFDKIEKEINVFKTVFFKTTEIILHSRDIRKCEGAFQILFDLKTKELFYKELNKILKNSVFYIIAAAVHKEKHIRKYGKSAHDPYCLSLSFIIERLIFCTDMFPEKPVVYIRAEERGKKEDIALISHYNSIMDQGTYFVSKDRLRARIKQFKFFNKRDNDVGLQISDLCAYPMARYLLNTKEPNASFEIIQDKIYSNNSKRFRGSGLKMFP